MTDRVPMSRRPTGQHVLAVDAAMFAALRNDLLLGAPDEAAAFLLARPVRTPSGRWRLVAHEVLHPAGGDYRERTPTSVVLDPGFVVRAIDRARQTNSAIILVHTHPFGDTTPSRRDQSGERLLLGAFERRLGEWRPHGRLILGPSRHHAALFVDADREQPLQLQLVGANVTVAAIEDAESVDDDRFDRQVRAFGEAGHAVLRRVAVAIVGLGGTGSVIAQQLAHLGISRFLLIDPDVVESTNRNRVVGTTAADDGRAKVDVAAAMIRSIQPSAIVEAVREDIRDAVSARRLLDADFFFLCTDSHGSRAVVAQLAYQYLLPGIDLGVAIHVREGAVTHIAGRVQMLAPSLPCLLCSEVLDSEAVRRDLLSDAQRATDPYIQGARVPQPAVISINAAAASLAVTMFLSAVAGIPVAARHQRLRLETGVVVNIENKRDASCPWCSTVGSLARGDSWPMPGRFES